MSVRYEAVGDGAILTLDRPERMNAVSEALIEALDAALDRALDNGARAILLTGAGRAFCAGGTIVAPLPEDAGAILETHLNPLLRRLADLPVPLIAAVNGAAVGAGMSLALAADVIIAAQSARFMPGFAAVGLIPDGGLSWLLPRSIGYHRAVAMLMLGETLDAVAAHRMGLVARVVDDTDLSHAGREAMTNLASGPTSALVAARLLLRQGFEGDFAAALLRERSAQAAAGRSADFAEGAQAFAERRKAQFEGR